MAPILLGHLMVFDTPAMDDCDGALERDIAHILSASPFDKRLGYVIPIFGPIFQREILQVLREDCLLPGQPEEQPKLFS